MMKLGLCIRTLAFTLIAAFSAGSVQAEQQFSAFLTGYSYWDNTPRGSSNIARPVVHREAGGTGTYRDPITLAVGHVRHGNRSVMDFPAGTRFYIPRLRKYAVVEDLCGDGNSPQNGPCHSGYNGYVWIDIYVDGKFAGGQAADQCMRSLTGVQTVIINPAPGRPVQPGPLTESGCRIF